MNEQDPIGHARLLVEEALMGEPTAWERYLKLADFKKKHCKLRGESGMEIYFKRNR